MKILEHDDEIFVSAAGLSEMMQDLITDEMTSSIHKEDLLRFLSDFFRDVSQKKVASIPLEMLMN